MIGLIHGEDRHLGLDDHLDPTGIVTIEMKVDDDIRDLIHATEVDLDLGTDIDRVIDHRIPGLLIKPFDNYWLICNDIFL